MQKAIIAVLLLSVLGVRGQELYVFTEPASNMPAHSISTKVSANITGKNHAAGNRFMQRYSPEFMLALNRKWMVHAGVTVADAHTSNIKWESVYALIKYRFYSADDVHRHFRMAVYANGAYTRSPFEYDDIDLQGDKSGVEVGLIATQLLNKLALSATVAHDQVLDASRYDKIAYTPARDYQAMRYSLSAGYLLLPRQYNSYKQVNMNLYVELLGQQTLDRKKDFWDLAPGLQFIFNSNAKLNLGYRFQVNGNMPRNGTQSMLISYERTFLEALKKRKH